MVAFVQFGLRSVQIVFSIIILGLVGNAIAVAFAGNPSSVNFAIFVAVLAFLISLFGLAAAVVEAIAIPIVLLVADAVATLFTFIAGVVLAAKLGVHSCGNKSYLISNNIVNGAHNAKGRCQELQAATAFFWFLFALFMGTLVMSALGSRGGGMSSRGGMRKGGPSMTQV